jgi:large subunit ribosomal protein L19
MANFFSHNGNDYKVGDMIVVDYRIIESENKERIQQFQGILTSIKGTSPERKMITIRKVSKSGIGVERIIPVTSPFIAKIELTKKSNNQKAKLYYLNTLSDQQLRKKLFKPKKAATARVKKTEAKA